jgi:drug/metabolite transporter (DMT)-like permease
MPHGIEWLLLLTIGIFTQIAQICMTKAFLLVKTSTIAPFQYLGAIYSLILGWFIFDEQLRFYSLVGIFLIIGGIILELYLSTINKKQKEVQ